MTAKRVAIELTFSERLAIEMLNHVSLDSRHPKFEAFLRTMPGFTEDWLVREGTGYRNNSIDTFWLFWLKGFDQLKSDLLVTCPEGKAQLLAQSEREGWRYADELEQERKRLAAQVEYLEGQLIKEAARTATETLRADQMSAQHSMQAQMHRMATDELARLKMTLVP